MNQTTIVKLYHVTNLMNLPAILREGILRGEVPVTPYTSIAQLNAPNLTANPNPADQRCWCRGATNKTKIRLTVEIPSDKLTSFRQVQKKYRMKSGWVKALDPSYERRHWLSSAACRCNKSKRSKPPREVRTGNWPPKNCVRWWPGLSKSVKRSSGSVGSLPAFMRDTSDSSSKTAIRTVGYSMANCQLPAAE